MIVLISLTLVNVTRETLFQFQCLYATSVEDQDPDESFLRTRNRQLNVKLNYTFSNFQFYRLIATHKWRQKRNNTWNLFFHDGSSPYCLFWIWNHEPGFSATGKKGSKSSTMEGWQLIGIYIRTLEYVQKIEFRAREPKLTNTQNARN